MTTPYQPNALVRAWYSFKAVKLPWRKKFFRGFDLDGNTFYEQYNPLTPHKLRRTVKYLKDGHYTDNNVTPQWMSWMRHTREHPPTIEELMQEAHRIQSTRQNALLINQKWEEERARLKLEGPKNGTKGEADGRLPSPGSVDEKGEWQPESWTPSKRETRL